MEILFKKPVVHPGLNVTVRSGSKWYSVPPGTNLILRQTGGDVFGAGRVLSTTYVSIFEIPPSWLEYEHDPDCREIGGLVRAMDDAYGKGKWNLWVTVLMFMVAETDLDIVRKLVDRLSLEKTEKTTIKEDEYSEINDTIILGCGQGDSGCVHFNFENKQLVGHSTWQTSRLDA